MSKVLNFIKSYKLWLSIFVMILIILVFLYVFYVDNYNNKEIINDNIELIDENSIDINNYNNEEINDSITIDIKGEVVNPGVYELSKGSRVVDAIEISGGVTTYADTSDINLSKVLSDENVIIVSSKKSNQTVKYIERDCNFPSINDVCLSDKDIIMGDLEEQKNTNSNSGKISINTATKSELMSLNGIGESKAADIINYRNENGLFQSIEDIKKVSGIGDKLFEKIKGQITV